MARRRDPQPSLYERTRAGRRLSDVDRELRRRARRRVSRQGNSLMIAIPPEFLGRMHLLPGEYVDMVFDDEWGGFFVRHANPPTFRPPALGVANVG